MKTSCIIIDPDARSCRDISDLLVQIPGVEVTGSFTEPQKARLHLLTDNPDLVFMEVNLPGYDGLMFTDSIKDTGCSSELVIVTYQDAFVLEAFRREVFDYVIKPVNPQVMVELVCRYKRKYKHNASPANLYHGKIRFNTLQGFYLLSSDDIIYIEADGNYSKVHLNNGTYRLITTNIGQMEERLKEYGFFRIDRSLMINLQCLTNINRKDHSCTVNYNGTTLNFAINRVHIRRLTELF